MKKLLLPIVTVVMFQFNLLAQCDTLLKPSAIDQTICANESLPDKLTDLENKSGGTWSSSEFSAISKPNSLLRPSYSQFLIYTYTNPKKTCTGQDSFKVEVKSLPNILVRKPGDVCENESSFSLQLNATPLGGKWFDTAKVKYVSFGKFHPTIAGAAGSRPKAHPLFYTYTDPVTQCSDTNSTFIIVHPKPDVRLLKDTVQMRVKDSLLDLENYVNSAQKGGKWAEYGTVMSAGKYYFSSKAVNEKLGYYPIQYEYTNTKSIPHCSNTATLVVRLVDSLVTSHPSLKKPEPQIFPNPSNGSVTINNSTDFSYRVYHISGALVLKAHSEAKTARLDLEKGTYWVVIQNGKGLFETRKLVVR